jgi:hypothetical protein
MKLVYEMTNEERQSYIKKKALNRAMNKLKQKNKIIKELRLS